jgi:hypothetical protein
VQPPTEVLEAWMEILWGEASAPVALVSQTLQKIVEFMWQEDGGCVSPARRLEQRELTAVQT